MNRSDFGKFAEDYKKARESIGMRQSVPIPEELVNDRNENPPPAILWSLENRAMHVLYKVNTHQLGDEEVFEKVQEEIAVKLNQ